MRLHNVLIDLRDLEGFDFYPAPPQNARRRFLKLLDVADYDLSGQPKDLDLDAFVDGLHSGFRDWVERESHHFLLLAALWAQACCGGDAAIKRWMDEIEPLSQRFDLPQHELRSFAILIRLAWRAHLQHLPWERRAVREWFSAVGAREVEDIPTPKDGRLTVSVLEAIGDPESSQGKELKRRYADVIGQPVPIQPIAAPLEDIAEKLHARFPWATEAVRALLGPARLQHAYGDPRRAGVIGPILLVGPPGSGKTHLLTYAAELLGLPHFTLPVGGTGDSGGLAAVARGWSSHRPSGPFEAIANSGVANPVLILDELEKASTTDDTRNGNVHGTLLSMLNGGGHYHDACLQANIDLTSVNFWATANDLGPLRGPLADRFTVIQMRGPHLHDFDSVLTAVVEDCHRSLLLRPDAVPALPPLHREAMRVQFKKTNGSIRGMQRGYREWLEEQRFGHY